MATKIQGITIELVGDTTGLEASLKKVNSTIGSTQSQLQSVEKLLKLDPTNTELLRQKQELLGQSIAATKEKLSALKEASDKATVSTNLDAYKEKYEPIKTAINETELKLKSLQKESAAADKAIAAGVKAEEKYGKIQEQIEKAATRLASLREKAEAADQQLAEGKISQEKYDKLQTQISNTENRLESLKAKSEET